MISTSTPTRVCTHKRTHVSIYSLMQPTTNMKEESVAQGYSKSESLG